MVTDVVRDTKPYVEADPVLGHRYTPGVRMTLPRPGGGQYELAINSQGIRANRDFTPHKPAGTTRIIVLGDSMAAGQYVSNAQRFTELLERRRANLEVINLALEGSGTDQQVLLYEHLGLTFEHDIVVLLPFLQNIRRNMAAAREAIDPETGAVVMRPKPRFELQGDRLVLHPPSMAAGQALRVDEEPTIARSAKGFVSRLPGAGVVKRIAYAMLPWEPFPEYADPRSPAWTLMAAIIQRLKVLSGERPLVLAPVFYSNYVRYRMATNYLSRFSELGDHDGIYAVDVLPYFKRLGDEAVRCFQEPYDMHFSADGHLVLANAIESELTRLDLLSP